MHFTMYHERKGAMEFDELTEEQKAKIAACETPDDLLALAREAGYELSDSELEAISGGRWHGEWCLKHVCDHTAS